MELQEQQLAPDFTLPAVGDDDTVLIEQVHLAELRGQIVVLSFYPKDDVTNSIALACNFRDAYQKFVQRGVRVFGISNETLATHKKFAVKYHLPFQLLSDADASVSQLYGVYTEKSLFGKKYKGIDRSTFLIDREGRVGKIWRSIKPEEHAREVLAAVDTLSH